MLSLMPERSMAKKMGRPKSGRNDATAKIDVEVLRKAKYVAMMKGKTLAEYLTEVVSPVVEREVEAIAHKLAAKNPKPPKS